MVADDYYINVLGGRCRVCVAVVDDVVACVSVVVVDRIISAEEVDVGVADGGIVVVAAAVVVVEWVPLEAHDPFYELKSGQNEKKQK